MITWVKGLISAAIGGAANGVTVMIVDPANFNLEEGAANLASVAITGAIVSCAMYLKQSPIP